MGKKCYGVRRGRCPGVYHSWPEAEAQIKGFKGAQFKGFKTLAEAESFVGRCG